MIAPDRLLVARDRARGENHAIAFRQRDIRMLVLRDACECGAWLALRAGQQRHDLVARQIAVGVGRAEFRNVVEIAAIAGDVGHPVHGAADHHDLAPAFARGLRHRADARDIRREGGDGHPMRRILDEFRQTPGDIGLARARSVAHHVGGIADQRQHALVTQTAKGFLGGQAAEIRRVVELPVARMDHETVRGADGECVRFRESNGRPECTRSRTGRSSGAPGCRSREGRSSARRPPTGGGFQAGRRRIGWRRQAPAGAATSRRARRYDPRARG